MECQIIPEKCIACGLCQVMAPEIFDYDDDGIVLLKKEPSKDRCLIAKEQEADCLKAYRKCPTRAILLHSVSL